MSDYFVVFDILQHPYRDWFVGGYFLLGSLGIAAFAVTARELGERVVGALFAALFFASGALTTWKSVQNYLRYRSAAETGEYRVAEGVVTEFEISGTRRNWRQTFRVDRVVFSFTDNDSTSAFHRTVANGAPNIRDRCVRIHYVSSAAGQAIIWFGLGGRQCETPAATVAHDVVQ